MTCRSLICWLLMGLLNCLSTGACQADERSLGDGITVPFPVQDLTGQLRELGPDPQRAALVVVLLSTECPVANSYIPTLNRLHAEWTKLERPVELIGFLSDPSVTREAAATHLSEFKVEFPVILDGAGELASLLKPTHTPEAFVLDADGKVVYRGRIDDTYPKLGVRRLQPRSREVEDAVTSLVRGVPVETAYVEPVGCRFEQSSEPVDETDITFNRHIAPLIHANCTSCHREGQVAPFALETFEDVSKRAEQILTVIDAGLMPPWRPHPSVGEFLGERRLSETQRQLLTSWVAVGAPEGDPADRQPAPVFKAGWQLGTPDLVLRMPVEFEIPADGPDIFQNFVMPLNLDSDKFCVAAEFRPGNHRVVHHTIFFLDSLGTARQRDMLDDEPGYRTFGGPGFLPTGGVGGWTPGSTPKPLPKGYSRYVSAGSDLVMQVHYHPTGKVERDQSEVGLYFVERPERIAAVMVAGDFAFKLSPGEKDQQVECSAPLTEDVNLIGLRPHMHLLGREMKAIAELPDGTQQELIWINDWHFYWQDEYFLKQPVRLPKGTVLRVEASYDNSADNPFNPHSPPELVRFGDESTDEMCFCFFLVATDSPQDLKPLLIKNLSELALKQLRSQVTKLNPFSR